MTNRVAGFMCRYVLNGHYGCSPAMAVIERNSGHGYSTTYLVCMLSYASLLIAIHSLTCVFLMHD